MTWDTFQSVQGALILWASPETQRYAEDVDLRCCRFQNWSVFGQVEYDFAPSWTLVAGVPLVAGRQETST